jgi:pyruvate formate lyase activating enzyme
VITLHKTRTIPEHEEERSLLISGVISFTSVDFPGKLAAVLFLQGCPWACRYCHNPHLRPFQPEINSETSDWTWEKARDLLESRAGFLDGVVFSGGEPTAQTALAPAILEARDLGYHIGLHTSGAYPARLEKILPLIDWVGLDIKAPLDERYDRITGAEGSAERVRASLDLILSSGIPYQLRTTVHPALLSERDLSTLHAQLAALGTTRTIIQPFRPQGCADAELVASLS